MTLNQENLDDMRDAPADDAIRRALSLATPQSFFLYAGAGSGKTRSLKNALDFILKEYGESFQRQGRQVGVVTYTNAARDEILRRVKSHPIFHVATIHSFAWTLVEGRTTDIKIWLAQRLPQEISKLEDQQARGRPSAASETRARKITSKQARLERLADTYAFTYSPQGDNFGRDALSHEEVIAMSSDFLIEKATLQKIVLSRYPFILIDESQDTIKEFMEALLIFEERHKKIFSLGLFGDTMQRIYSHGKSDLARSIPPYWKQPAKIMNHRSRERIVRLANAIRSDADDREQRARLDRCGGCALLYILQSPMEDKSEAEMLIRRDIAKRTGDLEWNNPNSVKILTLEHHMAATRLGFETIFNALDPVSRFRTSFRDGKLTPLRLFTEQVLPLIEAHLAGNAFNMMAVLREYSPLVSKELLRKSNSSEVSNIQLARDATATLLALFDNNADPKCKDILRTISETRLFRVPAALLPFCNTEISTVFDNEIFEEIFSAFEDIHISSASQSYDEESDDALSAWRAFLQSPFSEIPLYRNYVTDQSSFGTHQGVKGLEFPRVMVIADDASMRFKGSASYEKLLGAKALSSTDIKNFDDGKETSLDRTRRLLYVTCTRAEESLALIVYSDNPQAISSQIKSTGWFSEEEVISNIL